MDVFPFLLMLHFLGLAAGLGGGIALSQTGPRLVSASAGELPLVWKLERAFTIIGSAGVLLLVITGLLMVWIRYGGFEGMPEWFWAKMALVSIVVVGVTWHEIAGRRFKAGHPEVYRWMAISGRAAGISMVLAVVCAVLAFE